MKKVLFYLAFLFLAGVLGYSLWQLLSANRDYTAEARVHTAQLSYRPGSGTESAPSAPAAEPRPALPQITGDTALQETQPAPLNPEIARLRQDYPDAVGWLTVPGTLVDYPFVQGRDNDYYLRRDMDGAYLYAGTPFLDCRCDRELTGGNSIIYGHNMRNDSVFGTLERYKTQSFLEENPVGYVYLPDRTLTVEWIACVVTTDQTTYLYETALDREALDLLYAQGRTTRRVECSPEDRFLTLSTCDYERSNGRVVLVGVLRQ